MDHISPMKKLLFSLILIASVFLLTELFASAALLFRMRLNQEDFSKYEVSYSSAVNFIYKAGIKVGAFSEPQQVRTKVEPEPHTVVDPELGYRGLPGQYRMTLSHTVARNRWEHLRVKQTTNNDGTRATGAYAPNYKASEIASFMGPA